MHKQFMVIDWESFCFFLHFQTFNIFFALNQDTNYNLVILKINKADNLQRFETKIKIVTYLLLEE